MNLIRLVMIAVSVVSITACGGAEDRKAAYMEKAIKSIDNGEYDKARIELKNVLQIDPKDDYAYFRLAKIFERQQNYQKAFGLINKAIELSEDNTEYQATIGKYYLVLLNDSDTAKEKLAKIKKISADDIHGLLLESALLAHDKKFEESIKVAKKVLVNEPGNIEAAVFITKLLSADKKYSEAISILSEAGPKSSGKPTWKLHLANLYMLNEESAKAEEVLKELVANDTGNYGHYLNLAKFYLRTSRRSDAVDVLKSAIEAKPEDIKRRMELISFIENSESVEAAIVEAENQIRQTDDDGKLRMKLAQLYLSSDQQSSADVVLKKVIEKYSEEEVGIQARLVLAEQLIKRAQVEKAEAYVNEAYEITPNDSNVNLLKALIDLNNKKYDQGIISLRTVVKDDPENLRAYIFLADAHRANNEPDQAEDVMARAHENNRGNLENLLALAKYHLQAKDLEAAERVAQDYNRIDDSNYDALSIQAAVLNATGRTQDAKPIASRLIELFPDKPNGYLQSMPSLIESKQIDAAIELMENGLTKADYDTRILVSLAKLKLSRGDIDGAISDAYRVAEAKKSESAYVLIANIYSQNNQIEEAVKAIDRGIEAIPSSQDLYIFRAKLFAVSGENVKIKPYLKEAITLASPNNKIHLLLSSIYAQEGDNESAMLSYREILKTDKNNVIAMNNLAAMLVDDGATKADIDEAMTYAEKLRTVQELGVRDTVAWVRYHAGQYDQAAEIMSKIVEAKPDNQVFNYHYGMMLYKTGDKDAARKYLTLALDNDTGFAGRVEAESTLAVIR